MIKGVLISKTFLHNFTRKIYVVIKNKNWLTLFGFNWVVSIFDNNHIFTHLSTCLHLNLLSTYKNKTNKCYPIALLTSSHRFGSGNHSHILHHSLNTFISFRLLLKNKIVVFKIRDMTLFDFEDRTLLSLFYFRVSILLWNVFMYDE